MKYWFCSSVLGKSFRQIIQNWRNYYVFIPHLLISDTYFCLSFTFEQCLFLFVHWVNYDNVRHPRHAFEVWKAREKLDNGLMSREQTLFWNTLPNYFLLLSTFSAISLSNAAWASVAKAHAKFSYVYRCS